ncbi:hypothetical protein GCM10010176_102510 [Nonomuraea spiralis]|nr:hypothetical protein GCM10010176_102510 [Nonomuraea spiralis]
MVATDPDADRPDLEIRLMTSDDTVADMLDLVDVQAARGVDGPGGWLSGTDRSGVLKFQVRLNGPEHNRVNMALSSGVGKTPADVLSAIQLVADLPSATGIVVAVRGGRPIISLWRPEESEVRASPLPDMVRWAVTLLQARSPCRLTPSTVSVSPTWTGSSPSRSANSSS